MLDARLRVRVSWDFSGRSDADEPKSWREGHLERVPSGPLKTFISILYSVHCLPVHANEPQAALGVDEVWTAKSTAQAEYSVGVRLHLLT